MEEDKEEMYCYNGMEWNEMICYEGYYCYYCYYCYRCFAR